MSEDRDGLEESLRQLSDEDLCEIVHDYKGKEAAVINNGGKESQVAYIMHDIRPHKFKSIVDAAEEVLQTSSRLLTHADHLADKGYVNTADRLREESSILRTAVNKIRNAKQDSK